MTMRTKTLIFLNIALATAVIALFVTSFKGEPEIMGEKTEKTSQMVRSFDLKSRKFNFCGENLPMEDFDVYERMDKELLRNVYYHSSTIMAIKRAGSVFPLIESILKEEGLPDDLKYVAVAESGLENAISPAGARGVWQFMKGTGQQYGLEVSDEVDERNHVEKSTRAACKYLRKLKEQTGSWILAASAYNGGPDRIRKEYANQRAEDFFDMNLAAQETMQYVFRIVALKEVMTYPENYEYFVAPEHKYDPLPPYNEVQVTESVANWGDFAKKYGMSYRMFKIYNPWLSSASLTVSKGNSYTVRVKK